MLYNIIGEIMHYIKEINKRFNFINIIFSSMFLSIIIFLIDYYNIPSFIFNKYELLTKIFILLFISYAIKEIINKKIWKLFNIETINYFDKLIFLIFTSEILLLVYYIKNDLHYKYILLLCLLLTLFVLFMRLIIIEKLINKSFNKKTNIYSISDLYNNKISNEELILLEEKALTNIEDDLLNTSLFIENIETSLLQCRPKENFVIALLGKWGCGKTSLINFLKFKINNSNDAIIGVFNPWKYDNKLSLFKGFYNYIFNLFGKNYGYFNYKELFKKYENLVFNLVKEKTKISLHNIFDLDIDKDIESIKQSINDCINYNDKKLIIVIDDIDRLSKEQILLIFKTVKTLFNFNNIVYILCYDEDRIKKIFEKELNIDPDYLNKIVQNKIVMPIIENAEIRDIGTKCILNLLNAYNITDYNEARLKTNLNLIFKDFLDLREVIRFINTISISVKHCNKLKLDICDYVVLEYVKFKDLVLYTKIYNYSNMFISEDREHNLDYEWEDTSRFNQKAKKLFDELFEENEYMKELLSKVFPYVDNYKKDYDIRFDGLFISEERKKSILTKRCSNGRYFKNYFIIKPGFFTELSNLLDDFINKVNNEENFEKELDNLVNMVNPNNHDLLFELIEIKLDEIKDNEKLFHYIYNNIKDYEDNPRFLGLTSNSRAKILLSAIINNETNISKKKEYLDLICEKDLILLDSVMYWLGTDKYGNGKEDEIYLYGKELMKSALKELIDSNFNIFEDDYKRYYSLLFNKHLDDKEKNKQYLTSLINKDNIFRIIGDSVSTWIGTGVSYEYNESRLEKLVSLEKIEETLKLVDYERNEDQDKILDLYNNKYEKQYLEEINFENL